MLAPAFVEGDERPGDLRAEVAEDDLGGGVDAQGGGDEIEARRLRGEAVGGEVAVGLKLAEAGLGVGGLGVVPADAEPVVEALEGELGVLFGLELEDGEAAGVVEGEQVEEGAVEAAGGGLEGGDLGVDGLGEQVRVEQGQVAAEAVFEPALGLQTVERVALAGGSTAALDELRDQVAEGGFGFRCEGGFGGAGAEGDLLDAVEAFGGGGDADAGELEAVEQEA